jgi:hypothetical protein
VSRENVKLVRSIFAAQWADPGIEFVLAGGIDDGTWTGLVGMAEGFRQYVSAWEELHALGKECRALDDERVLVLVRMSGRGRISGVEMNQAYAGGGALFHVRSGMVSRLVLYATTDRAFADLGLEE